MAKKRGAVVIGVNKTGSLPLLEASADGADAVEKWLIDEGFEVQKFTDVAGPVKQSDIAQAIDHFVKSGTYQQLIIYFSGHGYWKNDAELWLLTDAPGDANAAVSWAETAEFAKDCGIPNVVMISDACRVIPTTPRDLRVRGSIVFPNDEVQRSRAKVDKFMAAAQGTAAYEVKIGTAVKKENVFTHCFLRAFREPDGDMVQAVAEDGQSIKVVPNRRLGKYLQREVAKLLANVNVALNQTPDAEVLSDDDAYIGRAQAPTIIIRMGDIRAGRDVSVSNVSVDVPAAKRTFRGPDTEEPEPPTAPVVHLRDVAALAVERALDRPVQATPEEISAIEGLSRTSGFDKAVAQAGTTVANVDHFETETGLATTGAKLAEAIAANGEHLNVLRFGADDPGVVRVERHLAPGATVLLRFTNGRGIALAALNGYIGHVVVEGEHVINVNYVPSNNSWRWYYYEQRRQQIERLRAAAAAAVQFGVFRLDDKQKASDLADRIRGAKEFDPTLGLYAAYAYSDADQRDEIDSVLNYMLQDLGCSLFDVAMLARKIPERGQQAAPIVPFCPMLTQGWNLLRARGIALPRVLDDAQDELEPALWTTFKPERAEAIFQAIQRGELQ